MQTVVDAINALPAVETITEETDLVSLKDQVNAARATYNALSDDQKAAFDAATLEKLTALEVKISDLESGEQETAPSEAVQNVIEKIDAAVEQIDYTTETITATDGTTVTKTHITMLKDLDPANNAELKALIDKEAAHEQDENQPALTDEEATKLSDARKVFEDAKAKYLSEGFSDAQLAARQAYDALAEADKTQVTNYSLLTDMEANIAYIMQAVNTLPTAVAEINGIPYDTLDEAIAAAVDGDTIEILNNCSTPNGFAIGGKTDNHDNPNDLTINGNGHTITLDQKGIYIAKDGATTPSKLTFNNCNLDIRPASGTPTISGEGYPWAAVIINYDCELTFNNSTVTVQQPSGETGVQTAFYSHTGAKINIQNGSTVNVTSFKSLGFGMDPHDTTETYTSEINIKEDSHLNIDKCGRGIYSTYQVTIYDSTLSICNNREQGTDGTSNKLKPDYIIQNSTVEILNNGQDGNHTFGHGMCARDMKIVNSNVKCEGNGGYGLNVTRSLTIDTSSTLDVIGNSWAGDDSGLQINNGAIANIASGATVNIKDNKCSGLSNWGTCTFEEGSKLTITGNINDKGNFSRGGGIYNTKSTAHLTLPSDAVICNNQAVTEGDDIYNTGEIIFNRVGSDWTLEETNLPITGWYYDGHKNGDETKRWKEDAQEDSYQLFNDFDDTGRVTLTGIYALKAAHAYSYNPETPVNPTTWEHSKSKTATNLDANYQSQVTLSLPAADYPSKLEIVFVVDGTAWREWSSYKSGIQDILDQLKSFENITADAALVSFGNTATKRSELTPVQDLKLPSFVFESSGTNIQSGIRTAREVLENGDPYAQKYMVLLTDGGAFYWLDNNGNSVTKPYKSGENGKFFDSTAQEDSHIFNNNLSGLYSLASGNLVNFREKYKAEIESFNQTATVCEKDTQENQLEGQYIYKTDDWSDKEKYPFTNMEQGIYNASQEMLEAANSGINLITIGSYDYYPDQPAVHAMSNQFLDWTSTVGKLYKFNTGNENDSLENALSDVKDELIYLLDEGSSIVDIIGEGIDNAGNEYDFKFINDINNLNLTVGGVPLNKTTIVENTSYGFGEKLDNGKYEFELTYYPDGIGKEARSQEVIAGELFRLDINVPITIDKPVQLTYTVQLTNPQTADGTYGQYDADGSEEYAGLYTNKMAILYPVDSNGVEGEQEAFQKPTVSYSISNGKPVDPPVDPEDPTPRPGGGGDEDDDTPTIINDTPVPTTTIDDEDVPLTDLPEDTVTIDDEEVPLKDIPNTGDMIPVPAMVAAVISIGGIALLMKKHK